MPTDDLTLAAWDVDAADFPSEAPVDDQARFLLRYAILAPSSHNAQPWAFSIDDSSVTVHAVEDRWLEVADQDKRELYISLGCAIENLCITAQRFDLGYDLEYHGDADPVATLTLSEAGAADSDRPPGLFEAITARYTNHQLFEDRPLSRDVREQVQDCVIEDSVRLHLVENAAQKASVAELQAKADRRQMANPEYRKELAHWIGIGALGDSWLKARIGQAVVTHLNIGDREAQKNSKLVTSAPAVGVLVTDTDDPTARARTGQVFERVALAAAAAGVAVHPMSQILELPDLRADLGNSLDGGDGRPQHLFRLGYPEAEQGHTPRWPLEAVIRD